MKTYVHQRADEEGCQAGWAEFDTMAPNKVCHECDLQRGHDESGNITAHVCACGLMDA